MEIHKAKEDKKVCKEVMLNTVDKKSELLFWPKGEKCSFVLDLPISKMHDTLDGSGDYLNILGEWIEAWNHRTRLTFDC